MLEAEKKKLCALRRREQRQARSNGTTARIAYNKEKSKLRKKIKRTKTSAWQKFCTEETNKPLWETLQGSIPKRKPPLRPLPATNKKGSRTGICHHNPRLPLPDNN
ncbi:hypothetical protein AVEN_264392-1 [Araneus ventricosus]|uniref:Uncharacterized protein n=1 Tax=Araneus ventricosus TaxID=182803 RepID=A0A4Y2H453_ARAVE|nr:hypothetical protein AVEN_264392-1 [Araneus ventricosus]